MKNFFGVLFGGLAAVGCGVALAYGGTVAWHAIRPHFSDIGLLSSFTSSTSAASPVPQADGTSISGLTRTVRYSADEEEDLISAATQALPSGADARISAGAYLLKDLARGTTAAEYNQDKLLPIASLTKLVTAVVARKLIAPDEHVTITKQIMSTYGNTASFRIGEVYRADDLLYPLLMVSSNDAAEAYAQKYGRTKFIRAMNDFAQSIGAYRTYFADPSGLSPENVSTANDLDIIVEWILKNDPGIIDVTMLKAKAVRMHTWVNPTHFLNWSNYIGGKNGYTTEANRTGIALFRLGKSKDPYIVIVLASAARDPDVIKLIGKVKE